MQSFIYSFKTDNVMIYQTILSLNKEKQSHFGMKAI